MRLPLVLAFAALAVASHGWACSVAGIAGPAELVQEADLIVRATAVGYIDRQDVDDRGRRLIRFDVLEVVKGPTVQQLRIRGALSPDDDYNDRPAPYAFVRPYGRRGDCFASHYRQGGQFLLMLKPESGGYTPYWSPLAPVNEQLHSDRDPWIVWVRREVAGRARPAEKD